MQIMTFFRAKEKTAVNLNRDLPLKRIQVPDEVGNVLIAESLFFGGLFQGAPDGLPAGNAFYAPLGQVANRVHLDIYKILYADVPGDLHETKVI